MRSGVEKSMSGRRGICYSGVCQGLMLRGSFHIPFFL